MKFKHLDIATADTAFEAFGSSLENLFQNAGLALSDTMVSIKELKPEITRKLKIESEDLESLLFDFISELLYYKDVDGLIFCEFNIEISGKYKLKCRAKGEQWDRDKHNIRSDVKAATYSMIEIGQIDKKNRKWHAQMVLDV